MLCEALPASCPASGRVPSRRARFLLTPSYLGNVKGVGVKGALLSFAFRFKCSNDFDANTCICNCFDLTMQRPLLHEPLLHPLDRTTSRSDHRRSRGERGPPHYKLICAYICIYVYIHIYIYIYMCICIERERDLARFT